jgi:hypothetical protein
MKTASTHHVIPWSRPLFSWFQVVAYKPRVFILGYEDKITQEAAVVALTEVPFRFYFRFLSWCNDKES